MAELNEPLFTQDELDFFSEQLKLHLMKKGALKDNIGEQLQVEYEGLTIIAKNIGKEVSEVCINNLISTELDSNSGMSSYETLMNRLDDLDLASARIRSEAHRLVIKEKKLIHLKEIQAAFNNRHYSPEAIRLIGTLDVFILGDDIFFYRDQVGYLLEK